MSKNAKISDRELRRIISERAMAVATINDIRNAYKKHGVKGAATEVAEIIDSYDISMGLLEVLGD